MKKKIQQSAAKNYRTIYFILLLVISIVYLVVTLLTPKINEINTIFTEISEFIFSKELIDTISWEIINFELEFLIEWFPYALVPFYLISIVKTYKKKKLIRENLDDQLKVDVVLHRHINIMQKMNDGQLDVETQAHGEIK